MKLYSLDRSTAMSESHHDIAVRRRRYLQFGRDGLSIDDERVIPRCGKRLRQSCENAHVGVRYFARLSVHQGRSADNVRTEDFTDSLMSEADAEDRYLEGTSN